MSASLYQLTVDLIEIEQALASDDPAVNANAETLIQSWVETNASLTDKIDAYAGLIRTKLAEAAMYKGEADLFKAKADSAAGTADRLKAGLKFFLETKGMDEVKGRLFSAKMTTNGGHQPVKTPLEPNDLPDGFKRITVDPDTNTIREALLRGEEVPGCELLPRGKHVRIN